MVIKVLIHKKNYYPILRLPEVTEIRNTIVMKQYCFFFLRKANRVLLIVAATLYIYARGNRSIFVCTCAAPTRC